MLEHASIPQAAEAVEKVDLLHLDHETATSGCCCGGDGHHCRGCHGHHTQPEGDA